MENMNDLYKKLLKMHLSNPSKKMVFVSNPETYMSIRIDNKLYEEMRLTTGRRNLFGHDYYVIQTDEDIAFVSIDYVHRLACNQMEESLYNG